jgi:hypothetical protein
MSVFLVRRRTRKSRGQIKKEVTVRLNENSRDARMLRRKFWKIFTTFSLIRHGPEHEGIFKTPTSFIKK